jgi:shikimate dehydrogenase
VTNRISGKAKLAGVIGWPVAHSLSPRLHNYWLEKHAIDGAYVPLAVKPEDFEAALRALPKLGFRGCNVTIPHKEAAFEILSKLKWPIHNLARAIGAVNTIWFDEEGLGSGMNTDAPGFIANLVETLGDWSPIGKGAVVLGAGGAARGVVAALIERNVGPITVINRSERQFEDWMNESLAILHYREHGSGIMKLKGDDFVIESQYTSPTNPTPSLHTFVVRDSFLILDEYLSNADLLVNTTSLGQTGQPPLDIDLSPLPAHAVVTDIVYNPLETDLLKRARARGLRTVDGLGMLIQQARPGFKEWFGVMPDADEATRAHLLAAFNEKK